MNTVDLSGMLADPAACGAFYIDASSGEALADAAARLGFAHAVVDLSDCGDKDAALARMAQALNFPPWFGGNWDALADCLLDMSWWPAPGYVIVLDHAQAWKDADPVGFDVLMEIGADVATDWAEHGVPFWLLVPAVS